MLSYIGKEDRPLPNFGIDVILYLFDKKILNLI